MPSPISIADQIAYITRELTMPRHVYPSLVRLGRMPQAQMDYEVACLQAVLATLEHLARPGQVDLFTAREEPRSYADVLEGMRHLFTAREEVTP